MDHSAKAHERATVRGKAVIVSGGTTGIGRATAQLLASEGARVLVFGRHEPELRSALEAIGAHGEVYGLTADQSREDDVRRVFQQAEERIGPLDVLVNNAAVDYGALGEHSLEDIRYVVDTNLVGYLTCAHEAVRRMRGRGGHIVQIGSMSADLREEENSIYVATKGAIQAFSESLRKTVNPRGIRVSLVEPGKVATDMVELSADDKEERIAAAEMLRPEDIADCVLFCLTQPPRCDIVSLQVRPHLQVI